MAIQMLIAIRDGAVFRGPCVRALIHRNLVRVVWEEHGDMRMYLTWRGKAEILQSWTHVR
jgi:hypothetical protein